MLISLLLKRNKEKRKSFHHIVFSPTILNLFLTHNFFVCCCCSLISCDGVFNAYNGKRKKQVALYDFYVSPLSSSQFTIGSYATLPSIISKDCTKEGVSQGLDGGKLCTNCRDLREAKGSTNPAYSLTNWSKAITHCIKRRHKETLIQNDLEYAEHFIVSRKVMLKPPAKEMLHEAKAQIEYFKYVSKLNKRLPNKT